jgi:hypothetical protein
VYNECVLLCSFLFVAYVANEGFYKKNATEYKMR